MNFYGKDFFMEAAYDLLGKPASKHALWTFFRFTLSLNSLVYSARILYKTSALLMGSKSSGQSCIMSRATFYKSCIIPKKSNTIIYWYLI